MTCLVPPGAYVVTSHQPRPSMLTITSKQVTRLPNRHLKTNVSSARKGKSRLSGKSILLGKSRHSWVSDDNAQGLHISHPSTSTPVEKKLVRSRIE
jgi:hypothetical protein